MPTYAKLLPGDPAPWFRQRTAGNPHYVFDTIGGRYVVLCFYLSSSEPMAQAAMTAVRARPSFFDDVTACFFGVTVDPRDLERAGSLDSLPGYRTFFDLDGTVSRLYGALPQEEETGDTRQGRPLWLVLNPTLNVIAVIPFANDGRDIAQLLQTIDSLPPVARFVGFDLQAPILVLPRVFEPGFCERLIGLYEASGGEESGFMREVDGKTVPVHDHGHKRRRDYTIEDPEIIREAQVRFKRRVVPMIQRAHQFSVTRMERYIVACYAAEDGGHFRAHRDNTTKGTAHRRFAVSVNLNDEFDGGEVSFPEYGPRSFKAPTGGAVVFSCSLLHAVSRVTRGRRFAFLPFLYDDAAAQLREQNNAFLADGGTYRSGA